MSAGAVAAAAPLAFLLGVLVGLMMSNRYRIVRRGELERLERLEPRHYRRCGEPYERSDAAADDPAG